MVHEDVPHIVLFGGGVESTLLIKQMLDAGQRLVPVHIRCGLGWEDCEALFIRRFLEVNACHHLLPLVELPGGVEVLLRHHWGVTGENIPRAGDSASRLEIPERNWTVLVTAARHFANWPRLELVLGTTADNSYYDGTRAYFDDCERRLTQELGRTVRIHTPLINDNKRHVIRKADRQTLALSFSCVDPKNDQHCGRCYKCGKRHTAFIEAGVADPTIYAEPFWEN
jgi:7-cyano-7-deazaguanine synthase